MRFLYGQTFLRFTIILILVFTGTSQLRAQCSSVTPTFTLDLSGSPNATSVTPSSSRNGTCCGGSVPCTKIVVLLHPKAMALKLTPTGADPGGALTYEFNCNGQQIPGGTPICLSGTGPQTLTICKVGNNPNSYSVESVPQPAAPDSVFVRNGCTQTLSTTGFSASTIQWTAINAGTNTALFNSYLNCTSGCPTVVVSPSGTVPVAYVDYEVSGFGVAPCGTNFYRDTARVFFYNNLAAPLSPTTICFGNVSAVLSPTPSGGKPPYTYTWSTGSNSSSITVGAGNYTLTLSDDTGCPPITSTVTVSNFTLPIQALIGPDRTVCKTNPNVVLNGTIVSASGGTWSATSGTFLPNSAALNATYVPSGTAISAGSVHIILGTTGNAGCQPDEDTVLVTFQNQPTISAGPNQSVCANNAISAHTAVISGYSASPVWTSVGGGTISSPNTLATSFSLNAAQVSAGTASIIVTTTNNGACPAARDTALVIVTPAPVVNAGPNQLICSNSSAALSGSVSPAPFSGTWSTAGDGTFSNPNLLNTNYTPGVADISTGSVSLVLSSTNNGNCLIVRDTVVLNISIMSTVTAITPSQICVASGSITISATVTGASNTGSWTTSGTGTIANVNSLNSTYFLSSGDQANPVINFTLTTTNNGPCPAATRTIATPIMPMPTVNIGPIPMICSSQQTISLGVSQPTVAGGSSSGIWTSSGTGTFVSAGNYTGATYAVSNNDILGGTIIFTLTSTNNGVCPADADTVMMRIVKSPTVLAGANQPVCSLGGSVALSGSVTGGFNNTGSWAASGSGGFNPGVTSLNTQYSLTSADVLNGFVIFTLTSTNNGPCAAQSDTAMISVVRMATVSAGVNQIICSSQIPFLPGAGQPTISGSTSTGIWTTSGTGTLGAAGNYTGATYHFSGGDVQNSSVIFTLTSTNNGVCPADADTVMMRIVKSPTVIAGSNMPVCSTGGTVTLNGVISGGLNNSGNWTSNGAGAFNPGSAALNTQYSLTSTDILNGSVIFTLTSTNNGPCAAVSDTAMIRVVRMATVSAGANQVICSSQSPFLPGAGQPTITGSTNTGIWTTSGSGTLNSAGNYTGSTYVLSIADIQNSTVIYTLTSTNNGVCPAVADTVMMRIIKSPTVNAGVNQPVCSSGGTVALTGFVSGGVNNSGNWTASGSGAFNPGPGSLNSIYNITTTDIQSGFVTFTLNSTNNGPCGTQSDTVRIRVFRQATVTAGGNQVICSTQKGISLNGQVNSTFSTGVWSTGGAGIFTPANAPVTTYSVTQNDINNGSVTFTLTSTNNGPCSAGNNNIQVQIILQPTVTASASQSICSTDHSAAISGTIIGGSGAVAWTSNGSGSFQPGNTALNTNYVVSNADISSGSVRLTLSSTNHAPCVAATNTLMVYVQTPALVNTGTYQPVCTSEKSITLNGAVNGGKQTGIWTTAGTGTFSPDDTALNGAYLLSAGDAFNGSVTLTLTSTDNAACPAHSQEVTIPVTQQVTVTTAADFSVCSNSTGIPLNATITGNSSGSLWSTSGTGSITSPAALLTAYNLSPGDIGAGGIMFYLTAEANGPCPAVTDSMAMGITLRPVVTLASDTSICASQNPLELSGDIQNGSGAVLWVSNGSGKFLPNSFVQNVSYEMSENDIKAGGVNLSLNSVDNGACGAVSSTIKVDIRPSPEAAFSPSTYTVELPGAPVVFTNETQTANQFSWTISNGVKANTQHLTHSFGSVGFYTIVLVAENEFECLDSTQRRITVISSVKFPTAFSPNGDKLNDVFKVHTDGVVTYELMIFNRWGEMIFKSESLNHGWDGRFKGEICQQDVYVWKARIKFFDDRIYEGAGTITLLK